MSLDLDRLLDRQRIVDLTYAYAMALDTKDWEALTNCFAKDGILRLNQAQKVFEGREAIKVGMAQATASIIGNLHPTCNHRYVVESDVARGTCIFVSYQWVADTRRPGALHLHAGRYTDILAREGAEWLFRDRTIDLQCIREF
jgi:ketosteroid isomerase-like protein